MYWWQEKPIYQIYPKSYYSANGNPTGDIRGIIEKLDYIESLNVSAIWLSPIFKSPMKDNGYDISDYYEIDPSFGTKEDLRELINKAHEKNIKVILDLVLNHTSDQHEWFKKSKNKDPKYRDYYVWRKEKDDERLKSWFTESAWEKIGDEYYLHFFAKEQPDLNWENPEVRKEMLSVVEYWKDFGADGYRLDVITLIGKAIDKGEYLPGPFLEENLHLLQNGWGGKDFVTIGEGPGIDANKANGLTDLSKGPLSMLFSFDIHEGNYSDFGFINGARSKYGYKDFDLVTFKKGLKHLQENTKEGWQGLFFGNHDFARTVSKFGNDKKEFWDVSTTAINSLLFFLRGTPFIYQGDEIGMINREIKNVNESDDTDVYSRYEDFVVKNKYVTEEQFIKGINKNGRDNARTPMQWSKDGGFTKNSKTWLPYNQKQIEQINVDVQESDEKSVLNFYRRISKFRYEYRRMICNGDIEFIDIDNKKLVHIKRTYNGQNFELIINWSDDDVNTQLPSGEVLISNYKDNNDILKAWEMRIIKTD